MKSILKVRILGIDYYTIKQVSINKTIECEDLNFIDKVIPPMIINNNGKYKLPETTVTAKQQADEWLSNQSDLLNSIIYDPKQELKCIINWEILSIENIGVDNLKSVALAPVAKKGKMPEIEKIGLVLSALEKDNGDFTEEFKNNFLHTYQEMKDVLGGISVGKKILIILRAMGVGHKASTNAYDRILKLYEDFDTKDVSLIGDGVNGA